jgi:phenylalanyl-tRNA synthetase beta chain
MKITTNLLKQFGDIKITDEELIKVIKEHIGEIDYYHNLSHDYEDIVIAEIKQKEDHPEADKLGIYQIDTGEEVIQVVAGDKSLSIGDKVAYMKIGSTVPYSIYSEPKPFVIKSVNLRGVKSDGMLGSEKELNIGSNHEKVMVLPDDAPVGEFFSKYYDLEDTVIDIENKALTNRGDLFGILGLSREINAILGNKFESPEWYLHNKKNLRPEKNCLKINIVNDAEILCPRYTAIVLDNIKISESPIWLKSALIKCGIKPINNVVDITNYIALLVGQPLHAFDYDKLVSKDPNYKDSGHINIRMAKQGEKILGIDEKLYELRENIMVIADSSHPIAIAGVIGGKDTEVDENTVRIVLESANFDKSSIRRTSMQLGIFTEAATKFKHNLDPVQCLPSLLKAVEILQDLSGCKIASEIVDIYNEKFQGKIIQINIDNLNSFLGADIEQKKIKEILENLEFKIKQKGDLFVAPPSWRRDIEIKEDIYEDIGRIYGFNNINIALPIKEIKPPEINKIFENKKLIREVLSNNGTNELLTYNFVDISSFDKTGLDSNLAYKIQNSLSPELSLMRTCILQSLLPKAKENIERGIDKFSIFEINISHLNNYISDDKLPKENWYLSLLLTCADKYKIKGSPYYMAKEYLEKVFTKLGISNIQYDLIADSSELDIPPYIKNILNVFDPNTSAIVTVQGIKLGVIGEIKNSIKSNYKLPKYTAGLEINIDELSNLEKSIQKYKEQPIYPSFTLDLCFEISEEQKYMDIENEIKHIVNSNDLWGRVECLDIYKDPKSKDSKKMTYRITASNYKKTLTEKDIKKIIEKITGNILNKYEGKQI